MKYDLQDIMETVNQSFLMHSTSYFSNYTNKAKLSQHPTDQYDANYKNSIVKYPMPW
jgi:hypothetical protein